MGDRGNIAIQQAGAPPLYLYTHWRGSDVESVLRTALARNQRWDDPSYLARIIFCELIGSDTTGETGFGISTAIEDNENPIPYVDCDAQTVTVNGFSLSFGDFVAMELAK